MPMGLQATFQYLARTGNPLADEVLIAALDSVDQPIRDLAFKTVLERRSPGGHREIFRRLSDLDEHCRGIVGERPDRLVRVVGEEIASGEPQQFAKACEAILSFSLYDALPILVAELTRDNGSRRQAATQTILELTEKFYGELCRPKKEQPRDQETARKRMISALEEAAGKFSRHGSMEVVEAFLLVSKQQNVGLRRMLQQPQESCHQAILDAMTHSSRGGVLRLLLSFLEDPQMPQAVKTVLAGRTDAKFLRNLVTVAGSGASKAVTESLARFDGFAWALPGHPSLAQLDDQGQADAMALLMATSIPRNKLLPLVRYLLLEGKTGGRRAAARVIHRFQGPEADGMVIIALNDEDPVVRACLVRELRPRNIPQAMSLLIRMVDTPHDEIRHALRDALPEFTFRHFMRNLEQLSDPMLATAGHLVRKIDAEAAWNLQMEMECLSPVRRRKAVLAANVMGLVRDLEETIIRLLSDEDHMVRIAAAQALADTGSAPSWEALRDALLDRSVIVQETAEQSLQRIAQSLIEEGQQVEEVVG